MVAGAALYAAFRSPSMAAASLIGGVLVDVDHMMDYLMERGMPKAPRDFFDHFYRQRHIRIVLVLHAWEWFLVMAAVGYFTGWSPWLAGLFIGYAHHLISDTMVNGMLVRSYSFLWRASRGFEATCCFK